MAAISSPGVGSGLDVTGMVNSLMAAEQAPLTALNKQKNSEQAKISAYGNIKNSLSQLQSNLKQLSDPNLLQALSATSSDNSVLAASTSKDASAGQYQIEVSQLASSQKLATSGQSSLQTSIGTGSISFDFGSISGGQRQNGQYSGASFSSNGLGIKTLSIDAAHSSLSGIRDAINAAGIGVTASIVNDGSNSPYRLTLSNSQTGASQSMKISVSGDTGLVNLLSHDPANDTGQQLSETVTAKDAKLSIDGIAISKASNTINDALAGVSLSLSKTNLGNPLTLSLSQDRTAISTNLSNFVSSFNQINSQLTSLSSYNTTSKTGAVLYGDSTLRSIRSQLKAIVTASLPAESGSLTRLSQVGIELQKDGSLSLNKTKLDTAIDQNFSQLANLFANTGNSSSSNVSYVSATSKTQTGSYAVNISQPASQGSLTGSTAASLNIVAGSNDNLSVNLDGISASVVLTAGTYSSAEALASEVQARINGNSSFVTSKASVSVSSNGGVLRIVSNRYGSSSQVNFSGNAASDLLGGSGNSNAGSNVAGSINNVAATGSGQLLSGATNTAVEGLKLKISASSAGDQGNLNYTQGFAYQLNQLISNFLDDNGLIAARTTGINSTIKKVDSKITTMQDRLSRLQKQYTQQFNSLDITMSKMNSTTSYLTQQLSALAKNN